MKPKIENKNQASSIENESSNDFEDDHSARHPINRAVSDMSNRTLYLLHRGGSVDKVMEELMLDEKESNS